MHDDDRSKPSDARARESDKRRALEFFLNVPGTVWTTDDKLVLTFIQGAYLKRLDVNPDRLVGKTIQSLLLDGREDHPLIEAHIAALDGHESNVRIEWGGRLYSARLGPLRSTDERICGCVGLLVEIGWIADEEGTLRESEVRLQRAVDANLIGIVFGDDQGHVTDANDAFLHLTGYSRDDLIDDQLSWPALTPVERHQRQIQALEEIVTYGRCAPFESELIRKDGSRVPVLIGAVRLSARRREGVAFVMDLTDRERRIGRVKLELACADALADGSTLLETGQVILRLLLKELSLRSAALWSATADGCRLVARLGELPDDEPAFDSLTERVLATAQTCWAPDDGALGVPLESDGHCYGALVLAGWPAGRPEHDLVELCERVAARIGKFVGRHGGNWRSSVRRRDA